MSQNLTRGGRTPVRPTCAPLPSLPWDVRNEIKLLLLLEIGIGNRLARKFNLLKKCNFYIKKCRYTYTPEDNLFYCSRIGEPGLQNHTSQSQSITRHVQSPAERRKDIVAQAMQEQKIFEESIPKQEPVVKQEPGVPTDINVSSSQDTKPLITATKSSPTAGTPGQRKPYQRSSNYNRQQVMPRLTVRYVGSFRC